jgi:hypothetical protein
MSPLVVVALVGTVVAVVRLRDRIRRRRVEKAAREDVAVSVASRLTGYAPLDAEEDAPIGAVHDELDETILAILDAEPNVYTKTALAKQVGSSYGTVLKRITALQDEGRIVPNVRGAKLALAPVDDQMSTLSTKRVVASE